MTRRQLLARSGAAFAAAGVRAEQARPNVLILMSDQHKRSCMGAYGDAVAHTPNLDALAARSVRFTDAYCTNPVCTPSRASLLTGLYTHNHGSLNNSTPLAPEHKTIAHHFARAGYFTGLVGKMHFVDAQTHGFEYRVDFNDWWQYLGPKTKLYADELGRPNSGSGLPQIDDLWRDFGDPWKGTRELDGRAGPVAVGGVSQIPERDHFDNFVARESVRFLKNYGAREQPFLLFCSFLKPHDPFMPAARFASMFRASDMKLPRTWGKVDLAKAPREIRQSIENNTPTPELRSAEEARRRIAFYYANLAQMDDCAGTVLRALGDLGLDRNTLIVYTSDHGEMLGEHGLWQKFEFYEGSCGVPLLIHTPGGSAARACRVPVSQVSLLPTLGELCGVPVGAPLDGTSFAAQVRQPETRTAPGPIFAEYNLGNPQEKYMIRDGDFKLTYWTHDISELYNLRDDPEEMTNLANRPEHRMKIAELTRKVLALSRKVP